MSGRELSHSRIKMSKISTLIALPRSEVGSCGASKKKVRDERGALPRPPHHTKSAVPLCMYSYTYLTIFLVEAGCNLAPEMSLDL